MDFIPIYSKLVSESLLSLYPIFVKKISLPIDLQLFTRLITYVLISLFFINYSWVISNIFETQSIILMLVNLLHIYSSYEGFMNLDSGVSYSIFNIYPLLILLFSGVTWKIEYFYSIGGLIFFILSNFLSKTNSNNQNGLNENFSYGFVMMIIAAVTEALIYFIVKNINTDNNWNQLFIAYFFGAILSSLWVFKVYWLKNNNLPNGENDLPNEEKNLMSKENYSSDNTNTDTNTNPTHSNLDMGLGGLVGLVGLALVINGIIGAVGYWLRFYSVYRLEPSIYSMLSFFGIIMAYIYGIVFNNESIDWLKIAGTILIVLSNVLIL